MNRPEGRAGVVRYINTLPMMDALNRGELPCSWEFVPATPARIHQMLTRNQVQAGLVSSYGYTQGGAEHFRILPDLSISSRGAVQSVMLFHRRPLPALRRVGLSSSSLTSRNLARLLLYLEGAQASYGDIDGEQDDPHVQEFDGILLIGDQALRELRRARFAYVSDLAGLWQERFGLPFVFALWIVRRDACQQMPQAVRCLYDQLRASVQAGRQQMERISREAADRIGYSPPEARTYLDHIHYDLGEQHIRALQLYFRLMAQYGLIEQEPELRFFDVDEYQCS